MVCRYFIIGDKSYLTNRLKKAGLLPGGHEKNLFAGGSFKCVMRNGYSFIHSKEFR